MVCFDEHYIKLDCIVHHPVTGDPLKRFVVHHESGEALTRFVLPAGKELTRWEIQAAAKDALKEQARRVRRPVPLRLVGGAQ